MNSSVNKISKIYSDCKKIYSRKKNIQKFIEKKYNISRSDVINISYNMQSGSYVNFFTKLSLVNKKKIYDPFIEYINKFFPEKKEILDFGCGELTSSHYFFKNIKNIKKFYANDISLNRVLIGQKYIKKLIPKKEFGKFKIFCSSHEHLPFSNNSIDLIITNHVLEPNNKYKTKILKELLRVSRLGLCLMEPHYEISSTNQKKRMRELGYIRNIEKTFKKLNYKCIIKKKKFHLNKNNIASIFIVRKKNILKKKSSQFIDFKTKKKLLVKNNFFYSKESFRLYPCFNNIPIFSDETQIFLPNSNF